MYTACCQCCTEILIDRCCLKRPFLFGTVGTKMLLNKWRWPWWDAVEVSSKEMQLHDANNPVQILLTAAASQWEFGGVWGWHSPSPLKKKLMLVTVRKQWLSVRSCWLRYYFLHAITFTGRNIHRGVRCDVSCYSWLTESCDCFLSLEEMEMFCGDVFMLPKVPGPSAKSHASSFYLLWINYRGGMAMVQLLWFSDRCHNEKRT